MDKHNAKTRKKLKQIGSIKDFESLIEQTMLSEEEKKILWLHYKEQKTMAFIADELGMSEITVKKKHSKMLMKIGKMFSKWESGSSPFIVAILFRYLTYNFLIFQ